MIVAECSANLKIMLHFTNQSTRKLTEEEEEVEK